MAQEEWSSEEEMLLDISNDHLGLGMEGHFENVTDYFAPQDEEDEEESNESEQVHKGEEGERNVNDTSQEAEGEERGGTSAGSTSRSESLGPLRQVAAQPPAPRRPHCARCCGREASAALAAS